MVPPPKKNYLLITFTGICGVSCLFFGMVLNGQFWRVLGIGFPSRGYHIYIYKHTYIYICIYIYTHVMNTHTEGSKQNVDFDSSLYLRHSAF